MAHTAWHAEPDTMDPWLAERYLWGVRMHAGGSAHWTGGDDPGALPVRQPERSEAP